VGDGGLTGEVKPNATSTDSERGNGIELTTVFIDISWEKWYISIVVQRRTIKLKTEAFRGRTIGS